MNINDKKQKLQYVIDFSLEILLAKLFSEKLSINLESSMQLYYSSIIKDLGELLQTSPTDNFKIELEHNYNDSYKYIDIQCGYNDVKAAIELKCFRKNSNRAKDTDMYDVLKDIERLQNFKDHQIKKFVCLTDDINYVDGKHGGHAGSVSIKDGKHFTAGEVITPTWIGLWKNESRNKPITIENDIIINWVRHDPWYYLVIDI